MKRGPDVPVFTNPQGKTRQRALREPYAVVVGPSLDGMFAETDRPNQVVVSGLRRGRQVSREVLQRDPWPGMVTLALGGADKQLRRATKAAIRRAANEAVYGE